MKLSSEELFMPSYRQVTDAIMALPAEEQVHAWQRAADWCEEAEKVCASEDALLWAFGRRFCQGAVQAIVCQTFAGCTIHLNYG
jgi:hypothetical protein